MFLSAWLPVHSSTETPSKGSLRTGLLWGPKGIPGLEERRAEWLTTSNFCFSMGLGWAGLGWGIFPCLKISSTPLRNLSFFFFFSFCCFFVDLIRGTRTETAVGCSESCRPGVRC